MSQKGESQRGLFLKALVRTFPIPTERLPAPMAEEVKKWDSLPGTATLLDIVRGRLRLFRTLHPTWYSVIETSLPASLQPLARCLTAIQESSQHQTSNLQMWLLNELLRRCNLFEKDVTIDTPSSLHWLFSVSYSEYIMIIDLIAVMDVTEDVRQIVDTKALQLVLSLLNNVQKKYLKALLHMPTKVVKEPIQILQKLRHGVSQEQIRADIHERGLQRMAIALIGESQPLVWHVVHTLDMTRGQYVEKKCMSEVSGESMEVPTEVKRLLLHAYEFARALHLVTGEESKL